MIGQRIAERFLLETEAGRGGMGVVYRACDEITGERVALKLVTGDRGVDIARFQREARVLASLDHPNVVRYIAHGIAGAHAYLAMEWLDGSTLADRAKESLVDTLAVIRGAAAGLGAAHRLGIVHRDVKPGNLFLVDDDPRRVKVLDFGIARGVGAGGTVTHDGVVVGTPYFMAPEQARAESNVDARADVYALGAVLYLLLTGRPPLVTESLVALLAAILMEEPVDVRVRAPAVPEALAALTMELLAKDPRARPADGRELLERLASLDTRPSLVPRALPALTEREQRVLCLVLAAGRFGATTAPQVTMPSGESDVFERLRASVRAHGGDVELLANGAFVARMDPALAPAEQAVRAARCARALRAIAPELPLAVVAGRGHFRGPIPVGEVVERGSALLTKELSAAPTLALDTRDAGETTASATAALPILLDDAMASLLVSRFDIERDLSGARLGEELEARARAGAPARCVGRARELAALHAIYREAIDEPIARAVVVRAGAGMGKTCLAEAFIEGLDAPTVWSARADPSAAGSPFGLLGELLRNAAGIAQGEALPARRQKLLGAVARAMPSLEPTRIEALAARLGDVARVPFERDVARSTAPDDPMLRGDALREAWLAWLDAVLARGPLCLVMDDLQWGDPATVGYVDAALRTFATRPLFVLALGRSDPTSQEDLLWAERDAQLLRLTRLLPSAARALARASLGAGAAEASLARLVERADGSPFFLEELVRGTREGEAQGEGLPATVLGALELRLAVLEPEARRVLRAGSVFGRRFWRGGLVQLLGGPARALALDGHLDQLARRELIDVVTPSRFAGEQELVFRQGLVRDAALAMLTDEDRVLGHRLAGEWLERAGEDDARLLASHYERGGALADAARWLARAAEQALEGDDLDGACALAGRALEWAEGALRGDIHLTLAEAQRWRGVYPVALEHARAALGSLPAGSRASLRAVGVAIAAAGRLGAREEVEAQRLRLMDEESEPGTEGPRAVALCRAASIALGRGESLCFDETLARAEALAARAPEDALARAWILTLRASRALRDGDQGAFVDGTAQAVAAYEAAGNARDACNQRVRLANGYVGLGDPSAAVAVLEEALPAARRMGLAVVEGYALQNLGHAHLRAGRAEEAIVFEERAIDIAHRVRDVELEAGCLLYAGEARGAVGDLHGAVRDAERAVGLLSCAPPFRGVARALLAQALLGVGQLEAARKEAGEARAALEAHSLEEGEALVRLILAEVRIASGEDAAVELALAKERLLARAAHISDPEWRDAFVTAVPHHARLLALASR